MYSHLLCPEDVRPHRTHSHTAIPCQDLCIRSETREEAPATPSQSSSPHYPTQLCARPGLRALILPTHPRSHSPFTCLDPKACISISWLHSSPPGLEGSSLTCKRRIRVGTVSPRAGHSGGLSPLTCLAGCWWWLLLLQLLLLYHVFQGLELWL